MRSPIHSTVFTVHVLFLRLVLPTKPPLCDKLNVFPSTVMLMATTRTFEGSSHLLSPNEWESSERCYPCKSILSTFRTTDNKPSRNYLCVVRVYNYGNQFLTWFTGNSTFGNPVTQHLKMATLKKPCIPRIFSIK